MKLRDSLPQNLKTYTDKHNGRKSASDKNDTWSHTVITSQYFDPHFTKVVSSIYCLLNHNSHSTTAKCIAFFPGTKK